MSTIATTIAGPKTYSAEELQAPGDECESKKKENDPENSTDHDQSDRLPLYAVPAALHHQRSVHAVRRTLHDGHESRSEASDAAELRGSLS